MIYNQNIQFSNRKSLFLKKILSLKRDIIRIGKIYIFKFLNEKCKNTITGKIKRQTGGGKIVNKVSW